MSVDDLRPHGDIPRELATATRATTIMAYAIALVGAGGGTLALRDGDLPAALIVWTTSLAVAALLSGLGTLLRATRDVTRRLTRLERRIDRATGD